MPGQNISTGGVAGGLRRQINAQAVDTYQRRNNQESERLSDIVDFPASGGAEEIYFFYESAPLLSLQPRGDSPRFKAFKGVAFTVPNYAFAAGISWHRDDEQDEQVGGLLNRVKEVGESAGFLSSRLFSQMASGSADADLLASANIPNAPDGTAAYSATDVTGGARFGVSGGNIVSATGQTVTTLKTDYFSVLRRFIEFTDTEGYPLYSPTVLDQGTVVMCSPALLEPWTRIVKEELTDNSGGGAGIEGILANGKFAPISLMVNPLITGNNWYCFLRGANTKQFFIQEREALEDYLADESNSDESRLSQTRYEVFRVRKGPGCNEPYAGIKVA